MRKVVICALIYLFAANLFPYHWTHRLNASCEWVPKDFWEPVTASDQGDEDRRQRFKCLRHKGLKDFGEGSFIVLKRWPEGLR